jgi:acyl-CoA thioester hydrolase
MSLFRFCTSLEVRFADLDAFGHVNHAKYFTFMEQGRFQYFDALGLWNTSRPFHELGIIIAEAHCSYKKPVLLGERVDVSVRVSRMGNKSFEIEYLLSVEGDEVALGRTTQVAYDYQSEKSIAVPSEWRAKIAEFEKKDVAKG